jgi:K+-transporting ATPase ATPase B chain
MNLIPQAAQRLTPAAPKVQRRIVGGHRIVLNATLDAARKLDPRTLVRKPVIFVTEVVATLVTVLFIRDLAAGAGAAFSGQISA